MALYMDDCPQCGREFKNYDDHRAWRRFCSIGCEARFMMGEDPEKDTEPVKKCPFKSHASDCDCEGMGGDR